MIVANSVGQTFRFAKKGAFLCKAEALPYNTHKNQCIFWDYSSFFKFISFSQGFKIKLSLNPPIARI